MAMVTVDDGVHNGSGAGQACGTPPADEQQNHEQNDLYGDSRNHGGNDAATMNEPSVAMDDQPSLGNVQVFATHSQSSDNAPLV